MCHKLNSEILHEELSFSIMSSNTYCPKKKAIQGVNLENLCWTWPGHHPQQSDCAVKQKLFACHGGSMEVSHINIFTAQPQYLESKQMGGLYL